MKYTEVKGYRELKAGDQIAVLGLFEDLHPSLKVLYKLVSDKPYYFHHGIYMGNDRVVDFHGETKSAAKPRKVDLKEFDNGVDRLLFRVDYEEGEKLPAGETIRMAKELISVADDESKWPAYDAIWNNCETMAVYLKTGKKVSHQAITALEQGFKFLKIGIGVAGLVASSGSSIMSSKPTESP